MRSFKRSFKFLIKFSLTLILTSCALKKPPKYQPLYEVIPVSVKDTIIGGMHVTAHREYVIVPIDTSYSSGKFQYIQKYKSKKDTSISTSRDTIRVRDTVYVVKFLPVLTLHYRPYITRLTLEQKAQLRDFVTLLDSVRFVRIEAYTDSLPPNDTLLNLQLSKQRAFEVMRYLKTLRPDINIQVKIFGSKNYLEPNTTEEGRMRNRRVFIIAIGTREMGEKIRKRR